MEYMVIGRARATHGKMMRVKSFETLGALLSALRGLSICGEIDFENGEEVDSYGERLGTEIDDPVLQERVVIASTPEGGFLAVPSSVKPWWNSEHVDHIPEGCFEFDDPFVGGKTIARSPDELSQFFAENTLDRMGFTTPFVCIESDLHDARELSITWPTPKERDDALPLLVEQGRCLELRTHTEQPRLSSVVAPDDSSFLVIVRRELHPENSGTATFRITGTPETQESLKTFISMASSLGWPTSSSA